MSEENLQEGLGEGLVCALKVLKCGCMITPKERIYCKKHKKGAGEEDAKQTT